ncbi:MAG: ectonucleotide pyrophosphatase/phosphodiesterase [Gemmatimonadales bacterium]
MSNVVLTLGFVRRFSGAIIAALLLASLLFLGASGEQRRLRPTVILVSLDGFRWDFMGRADTPNLDRLVANGVRAERLVPVFPSLTFPNHYSIVTGLYAEHHGIVSNTMYDPDMHARFRISDQKAVSDGRWWGGEPLWVTAQKQGQVAASFFWPGSEAVIDGMRPTFWKHFDSRVPHAARVAQVMEWLDLPEEKRPTFVTMYFRDVDHAAHDYDPDSAPQVDAAIARVDSAIGLLLTGLDARGITDQVNVIVVADHGMAARSRNRVVLVDDYVDLETAKVIDWNPNVALRPDTAHVAEVYEALKSANVHLKVYRKEEIPARFHYRNNPRIAPILGMADVGWSISSHGYYDSRPERFEGGSHGWDNQALSMGALFVASGPAFRRSVVVPPFQNIHIYDLVCHILGLTPAPNDGSLDSVRVMLQQ